MVTVHSPREVVKLHSIEQWFQAPQELRVEIQHHIRLKDRLSKWLTDRQSSPRTTAEYVRCSKCSEEHPGLVLVEPRYPGIHPSQIAQPCSLKIYKEMIGEEGVRRIEPNLQLIFDTGTAVHRMFQEYGRAGAWGPYYHDEVRVSKDLQQISNELMIEGSADAEGLLIVDSLPGPIYEVGMIHEYKTIKSESFARLTGAKPEHKRQAQIYAAVLNRPLVVYLYYNKNTSHIAEYVVPYDHNLWTELRSKMELLVGYFNNKTPPSGEVGFHCADCPYVFKCEDYRDSRRK